MDQRPLRGAPAPLGPVRSARRPSGDGRVRIAYGERDLSPREVGVLRLFADGLSYDDIAARLGVRYNVVKTTLQRIREKTGVGRRRDDLVRWAREHGFTSSQDEDQSGSCYDSSREHQTKNSDLVGTERDPAGDHPPGGRTAVEETP